MQLPDPAQRCPWVAFSVKIYAPCTARLWRLQLNKCAQCLDSCTLHCKNSIDLAPWKNKGAVSYSEYNHGVKYKPAFCGDLQAHNAPFNASLIRPARVELG